MAMGMGMFMGLGDALADEGLSPNQYFTDDAETDAYTFDDAGTDFYETEDP